MSRRKEGQLRRRLAGMSDRKLGLALTLGIVLEVLEILRRTPRWLLLVLALVLSYLDDGDEAPLPQEASSEELTITLAR